MFRTWHSSPVNLANTHRPHPLGSEPLGSQAALEAGRRRWTLISSRGCVHCVARYTGGRRRGQDAHTARLASVLQGVWAWCVPCTTHHPHTAGGAGMMWAPPNPDDVSACPLPPHSKWLIDDGGLFSLHPWRGRADMAHRTTCNACRT